MRENGEVTTVDVWDTLLRRRCHPDEVKLAAAKFVLLSYWESLAPAFRSQQAIFQERLASERAIGARRRAEGLDDEYELEEVWRETIRKTAPKASAEEQGAISNAVSRFEWGTEYEVSYPDSNIAHVLRKASRGRLFYLSDYYVDSQSLGKLLSEKHPDLRLSGGFASCSEGLNKRSGRLFGRIQDRLGITPDAHRHIGDNWEADVSVPRQQGVVAMHFVHRSEEGKRSRLRAQFARRMAGDYTPYWKELENALAVLRRRNPFQAKDSIFNFGLELSPLLVLYVAWVVEQAAKGGFEQVHYFTREGEILKSIHECIRAAPAGVCIAEPVLLEVSRMATFGPSLKSLSLAELNRIWTMYPRHSVRTLFATLGVSMEELDLDACDVGIPLDEVIERPWENAQFRALLDSPRFGTRLLRVLDEHRARLLRHLAAKGISDAARRVLVVDIGWRGTIQDNLARVLPGVRWSGLYLALFRFLNTQPKNSEKMAYLFDENRGDVGQELLSPQSAVEMLFNSENGSVTGYSAMGAALREVSPGENRVFEEFTRTFHEGVLAAAPTIWAFIQLRGLLAGDLTPFVKRSIDRLMTAPPRHVARAYFALEHNETFGNGRFVRQEGGLRFKGVAGPRKLAADIKAQAWSTSWPAGFYAANGLGYANRAKKAVRRLGGEGLMRGRRIGGLPREAALRLAKKAVTVMRGLRPSPETEALKSFRKVIELVGRTDLHDPKLRDFNALHASDREDDDRAPIMTWIIPDIGYGSGGHMTILRFARYFRSLGVTTRIHVLGRSSHGKDLRQFIDRVYLPTDGLEIFESSECVEDCDVLVATHWYTAYDVFSRQNARFKAYFIQDFEPYFYPKGSMAAFAENTYRMNFYGICASPWLQDVVSARFGMRAGHFHLGYDPSVYYPDPMVERDNDRVLVYMRPSTERRGTELLKAALALVAARRPQTRIAIFGAEAAAFADLPFRAELLGLQNEHQLRRQHCASAISLQTSMTNYSLLPIEAMACGSVVVDLDGESTRGVFGSESPMTLASPDPVSVAREVIRLLDDHRERERLVVRGLVYVKQFNWDSSFARVERELFGEYYGRSECEFANEALVRAIGSPRIYRIWQGARYSIPSAQSFHAAGFRIEDVQDVAASRVLRVPAMGELDDIPKVDSSIALG